MANDAFTQQALADSSTFQLRLKNALSNVAWQVLNEGSGVTNHAQRAAFARQVISNPAGFAQTFSTWFVTRTNILSVTTSYDFEQRAVVTAATDAAMESQLQTDWNILSGV